MANGRGCGLRGEGHCECCPMREVGVWLPGRGRGLQVWEGLHAGVGVSGGTWQWEGLLSLPMGGQEWEGLPYGGGVSRCGQGVMGQLLHVGCVDPH